MAQDRTKTEGVRITDANSYSCDTAMRKFEGRKRPEKLASMTCVAPMRDLPVLAEEIVAGRVRGRVVIQIA